MGGKLGRHRPGQIPKFPILQCHHHHCSLHLEEMLSLTTFYHSSILIKVVYMIAVLRILLENVVLFPMSHTSRTPSLILHSLASSQSANHFHHPIFQASKLWSSPALLALTRFWQGPTQSPLPHIWTHLSGPIFFRVLFFFASHDFPLIVVLNVW